MAYDIKLFYLFNNLSGKSEVFDWFAVFFADYFEMSDFNGDLRFLADADGFVY